MNAGRALTSVAGAVLLAGCALKDPPAPSEIQARGLPGVEFPDAWRAGGVPGAVDDDWLATFSSPQLNDLVREALAYNLELQAAAARVDLATANLKAAGARLLPSVDVLARGGGKSSGDGSGIAGVSLSANWELDLWGRVRYGRRMAEEQYYSVLADAVYMRQSIAAAVARAWFVAIEARQKRDLARAQAAEQQQIVSLADERLRVGRTSEVDLAIARADLFVFQDAELAALAAIGDAHRALELLLGRYPGADLESVEGLPALVPTPTTGMPSELLDRRPDVLAARHRVAAAFSGIELARTLRLPSISLTASGSHISSDLFVLEQRDDIVGSAGARIYLPIFNNGEITAQIEARTAEERLAVLAWSDYALRAFNEVESALAHERMLGEREPLLASQVDQLKRAAELKRAAYETGTTDLQPVLDQAIRTFSAQAQLLSIQSQRRLERVNLFLALGGGFATP